MADSGDLEKERNSQRTTMNLILHVDVNQIKVCVCVCLCVCTCGGEGETRLGTKVMAVHKQVTNEAPN